MGTGFSQFHDSNKCEEEKNGNEIKKTETKTKTKTIIIWI